jgi:hypothetical protein
MLPTYQHIVGETIFTHRIAFEFRATTCSTKSSRHLEGAQISQLWYVKMIHAVLDNCKTSVTTLPHSIQPGNCSQRSPAISAEEFKLEELLRECKLFEKDSDNETMENCNRLAGLIREKLSVKRWRDFFCIVGLDLQEIGFNDEERSALMSLIKFASDFNRKSLVAQVDQFKKHLTNAVELYSTIMTSLSEATQFVRPGAPLDIFPDEIASVRLPGSSPTFRVFC